MIKIIHLFIKKISFKFVNHLFLFEHRIHC